MENLIKAIKFYMGVLPVDNPDEGELIEMPDMFSGQFMLAKKGHRRSLEVTLGNSSNGEDSGRRFYIERSFPFWTPKVEEGIIKDEMNSITRKMPYVSKGENAFGGEVYWHGYSDITAPSVYFFNGQSEIYGKFPLHPGKKHNKEVLVMAPAKNLSYYDFYSMDKNMNIHSTRIDLKYLPSKDLIKFTVIYDEDTRIKLDTTGNYSIKQYRLPRSERSRKGNLLSEKDFTLYLNKDIPIKIYAEPELIPSPVSPESRKQILKQKPTVQHVSDDTNVKTSGLKNLEESI